MSSVEQVKTKTIIVRLLGGPRDGALIEIQRCSSLHVPAVPKDPKADVFDLIIYRPTATVDPHGFAIWSCD